MKHYFLLMMILGIFYLSCKKDKNQEDVFGPEDMIGIWNVDKLEIGGVDTTDFLRQDSTCFPRLHFFISPSGIEKLELFPRNGIQDSLFRCPGRGTWFAAQKIVNICMTNPTEYVEPFLSESSITWNVVSYSNSILKLKYNYNGSDCYLTINKEN